MAMKLNRESNSAQNSHSATALNSSAHSAAHENAISNTRCQRAAYQRAGVSVSQSTSGIAA